MAVVVNPGLDRSALTRRGMDSTRSLKVCCGIWHQDVRSRSFKSSKLRDSIRKFVDKSAIKFARGVKLETKNGKTEDRILVITTWRLYLMASKVPTKVSSVVANRIALYRV
ncbi:hypothetical protein QTP86_009539 [Hemibagrus guttatus]|nr:hypothetical protein QTP86_009539 [Hemibagrus guttatus]